MAKNDRYVVKHPEGWAVTGPGHERASGIFDKQQQAEQRAKEIVGNLGGGKVRIQGRDGGGAIPIPSLPDMTRIRRSTGSTDLGRAQVFEESYV